MTKVRANIAFIKLALLIARRVRLMQLSKYFLTLERVLHLQSHITYYVVIIDIITEVIYEAVSKFDEKSHLPRAS